MSERILKIHWALPISNLPPTQEPHLPIFRSAVLIQAWQTTAHVCLCPFMCMSSVAAPSLWQRNRIVLPETHGPQSLKCLLSGLLRGKNNNNKKKPNRGSLIEVNVNTYFTNFYQWENRVDLSRKSGTRIWGACPLAAVECIFLRGDPPEVLHLCRTLASVITKGI